MFTSTYEEQFSIWKKFRTALEKSESPFEDTIRFWHLAPLVNKHLEQFRSDTWPDPWQIIKDGKYNDLTINLMIGHTLRFTERFKDSNIEIRIYLDTRNEIVYNTCYIDNKIINCPYGEIVSEQDLPEHFSLQMTVPLPDYK